jgi:hypothetical protein
MGVTATTRLPAGWYPDPEGDDHRRWWDGQEWTQYTAEFQRPTSVEEPAIEPTETVAGKKASAGKKAAKVKATRRLRPVEADDAPATIRDGGTAPGRSAALRLGRWLAGAVHSRPLIKKRRRAHRSTR